MGITRENADIFNTFDEIELGDNCVQNVHLGRYIVGYIRVAVKRNFLTI